MTAGEEEGTAFVKAPHFATGRFAETNLNLPQNAALFQQGAISAEEY
jgi:hypothetical protein